MNKILNNHAEWLDYNVSKVAGDKCRKQAIAFAEKDERQRGVKKRMTDQTRWGIDLIHTKNKAIKRQKDIINRSLLEVEKLEEQYIVELMMEIEAIYERKYGEKKANKLVL